MVVQLFAFEKYVVEPMLMKGFSRQSVMFSVCRINHSLFVLLSYLPLLFIFLFWYMRIPVLFGQSRSLQQESTTRKVIVTWLKFSAPSALALGLVNGMISDLIVPQRSRDFNPYKHINQNMTACIRSKRSGLLVVIPVAIGYLVNLICTAYVAALYIKRFHLLVQRAAENNEQASRTADKEQRVIAKSCIVALVSMLSTLLLATVSMSLGVYILFFVDFFLNTLCIVLYFDFASDYYRLLCSCFERGALCICGYLVLGTRDQSKNRRVATMLSTTQLNANDSRDEQDEIEL